MSEVMFLVFRDGRLMRTDLHFREARVRLAQELGAAVSRIQERSYLLIDADNRVVVNAQSLFDLGPARHRLKNWLVVEPR